MTAFINIGQKTSNSRQKTAPNIKRKLLKLVSLYIGPQQNDTVHDAMGMQAKQPLI
jgi:hypothetical protein